MPGLARVLIGIGVLFILTGVALLGAAKLPWLGRLPGDLFIQRDRFTFYFPLVSCLLLSLLLSLLLWLINRFR
ncbi:MAG: DUF2905 domain-containing protein [Candidatus Omnitrophica bacterium]|nr:DUF2905 domain-containing protein [Candidatus Omnitrophota bacterium]